MNNRPPLYRCGDIVLYKHRVTVIDYTPVKIITFLGRDAAGIPWYIVVDERRVLTGMSEDWLKSADGLTAKQISRLTDAKPRDEQLASLIVSVPERYRLTRES